MKFTIWSLNGFQLFSCRRRLWLQRERYLNLRLNWWKISTLSSWSNRQASGKIVTWKWTFEIWNLSHTYLLSHLSSNTSIPKILVSEKSIWLRVDIQGAILLKLSEIMHICLKKFYWQTLVSRVHFHMSKKWWRSGKKKSLYRTQTKPSISFGIYIQHRALGRSQIMPWRAKSKLLVSLNPMSSRTRKILLQNWCKKWWSYVAWSAQKSCSLRSCSGTLIRTKTSMNSKKQFWPSIIKIFQSKTSWAIRYLGAKKINLIKLKPCQNIFPATLPGARCGRIMNTRKILRRFWMSIFEDKIKKTI